MAVFALMTTLTQWPPDARVAGVRYRSFPLTKAIHDHQARIRIVDCGRRFGKSLMAIMDGLMMSKACVQRGVDKPRGLIVAPTNQMLRENWWIANERLTTVPGSAFKLIAQSVVSEWRLDLGLFGQVDFKSTESQGGAGRGAGYDWAILDEASRIPKEAWESDIRPALSDKHGRALIISTPNGLNWFYDLYQRGLEGDPAMAAFRHSTLDGWRSRLEIAHPDQWRAAQEEWELLKRTTSDAKFRQEFLAEFLAGEGQHFSLKPALWRGELRDPVPGCHYVAGVDVARKEDWMATAILEVESQQLVGLTRSRHQDWALQKAASLALIDRFPNCLVHIDSTGVGDPIAQDYRNAGLNIIDVLFTPKTKQELVENLTVAIDQTYLGIPDTQETHWLIEELKCYESIKQPSGAIRYGAPEGRHDDGVTALMLAAWGLRSQWRTVEEHEVITPHWWERDDPWKHLAYEHRLKRFHIYFPSHDLPRHPLDWAWTKMDGRN